MEPKLQQQIMTVVIGIVSIGLMVSGYSADQINTMTGGVAALIVGILALYTEAPKKQ
jgi:uncharacterized membrane protein